MAGERGSAATSATMVVIMLSMSMLFHCHVAEAQAHIVQWTKNPAQPTGPFKVGEDIVFQYTGAHNVVQFTGEASCTPPPNAVPKNTGNDKFTLQPGQNNFICSLPGHCTAGMKLSVTAN